MKNTILTIIQVIVACVCLAAGAYGGYWIGDWALGNSSLIAPKDFLEYRVVLPVMLAILAGGCGWMFMRIVKEEL